MHRKCIHAGACALVSVGLAVVLSRAASEPEVEDEVHAPGRVTRIRRLPAVTEANAAQVVQQAVQAAERGEFDASRSNESIDRVFDYPSVTLKRLVPYSTHLNDDVRSFVARVADSTARDDDPAVAGLQGTALSMLSTIAADPTPQRASSGEALSYLAVIFIFDGDRGTLKAKLDRALLQRSLLHFLSDSYDEDAALLLALLPPDPKLKPFVDRMAKDMNYQAATVIALAHWNDVKGVSIIEEKIKLGSIADLKYFTKRAVAVDHPAVLRALWNRFGDRRPTEDWTPADGREPPRVCDYILAGFKLKFDHKYSGEFPEPASDDALARAKERYRVLIDALPVPNAPHA